jgi:hypothetical protein
MATTPSYDDDESNMLLPSIIDRRAHLEPQRLFCVLLNADTEGRISQIRDVSYSDYANAVNKCAWWLESRFRSSPESGVLGYLGPPDIRYSIVALAAAKTNRQV